MNLSTKRNVSDIYYLSTDDGGQISLSLAGMLYKTPCPTWKELYGCTSVRRPDMDDPITRLCPKTCDLCPDSGEEPGEPEGAERQGSYYLL